MIADARRKAGSGGNRSAIAGGDVTARQVGRHRSPCLVVGDPLRLVGKRRDGHGLAPVQSDQRRIDQIADLMRAFLEAAGYEVATAESGQVALALLEEARFDAVISDLRMPGLDGAGLHRALRQSHPDLAKRLLFVTGDTLSPGARSFLTETGCTCLDKPFSKADLLGAVQDLLKRG